ncbi:MAG TPA: hypothetical protein PKD09_23070 [Aggregatilinea sp.]|jgi:hypothetical protein|uniref:hypothetical protein n=1 Tax=Aggregatilinea sp. TaxID=2806333 RepID=UPI002CE8280A|nr:hypothetical protein [Aggregatilinea sp.]HML24553.1 hypothetical protein [Aggregatilinea sp.]
MDFKPLIGALSTAEEAVLLVGAGISYGKIPTGYQLPIQFGEQHRELMRALGLFEDWEKAYGVKDWTVQKPFVEKLVDAFSQEENLALQQTLVDWMQRYKNMMGARSNIHATFVIAWLLGIFEHLITTNWDFLLEWQIDKIYYDPRKHTFPFEPSEFTFKNGTSYSIDPDNLYVPEPLDEDEEEFFWAPRWDIMSTPGDLDRLQEWTRPLWKIHGSPFFLACPKCGGQSYWQVRKRRPRVGDPCPVHPDQRLEPEITFWGQSIDEPYPEVWGEVKARLERADLIVVCGLSGSGSDSYIRRVVEANANVWLVNPSPGDWDLSAVHHVKAKSAQFAARLRGAFLT